MLVTELFLGPLGWVDLTATDRVRQPVADSGGGITITRDRPAGQVVADPGRADLVLANTDGAFSPRNPRSPYFGILGRNTPIRIAIQLARDDFDRTLSNTWGTTPTGQGWDVFLTPASAYAVAAGLATQSHTAANLLQGFWLDVSAQDAEQVSDIQVPAAVTGAAAVAGHVHRYQVDGSYYWIRLEFNAGGSTTAVKISRSDAGEFTTLAEIINVPGLSYTAGQPLRLRTSVVGRRLSLMAWDPSDPGNEPADWILTWVDDSTDAILAPGAPGLQSWLVGGNSNSKPFAVGFANYELLDRRAWMEVPAWPPRWNVPGTDVWAPIEAAGIMRRLNQGKRPVRSALDGYLPDTGAKAWWPLNDGRDSTIARSGLPDGQPLTVRAGVMDFVPEEGPPGAGGAAHPEPSASNALTGRITGVSDQAWHASIWTKGIVADPEVTAGYYLPWELRTTTGKILRLIHQYEEILAIGVGLWDSEEQDDETHLVALEDNNVPHSNPGVNGQWIHVTFSVQQVGADCNVYLNVGEVQVASGTWTDCTVGAPIRVDMIGAFTAELSTVSLNLEEIYLSEFTAFDGVSLVPQHWAGLGFPGEDSMDRLERVCAEEGVPISIVRGDRSPAMGPQLPATFLDTLRDCAEVDQGLLGETRERIALSYRSGSALLNQPTALELDYTAGHLAPPLEPVDDDQDVRNDITVKRANGSSAQAVLETGRMSVLPPEEGGIGRYDVEYTVNTAGDLPDLPNQAWWRLHVDAWDEARYPSIKVNLAAPVWDSEPELAAAAVALEDGRVIALTNLPLWLPPGPTGVMVRGAVEYIGDDAVDGLQRSITWSASPAGPYATAVAGGSQRVPARGSTLAADLASPDTGLLLASTLENGLWVVGDASTYPNAFPLPLMVGGEEVTASEIGPGAEDTMGVTVASGWGTDANGRPWSTVGGSAADFSKSGGTARQASPTTNVLRSCVLPLGVTDVEYTISVSLNVTAAAGAGITLWLCSRYIDASNYYATRLDLGTGGTMTLGLYRRVAGTLTQIPGTASAGAGANTSGHWWRVNVRARGTSLAATAQNISSGGAVTTLTGTDASFSGRVGDIAFLSRRETGNTDAALVVQWDDLIVPTPQLVTVTRGVNGVQRAWPVGVPVQVRDRAIAAW